MPIQPLHVIRTERNRQPCLANTFSGPQPAESPFRFHRGGANRVIVIAHDRSSDQAQTFAPRSATNATAPNSTHNRLARGAV